MPLTLEQLQGIQADAMADDIEIDFAKMSLWSEAEATAYFESGGEDEPGKGPPPPPAGPPAAAPLPKPSAEEFKKWFPKWKPPSGPVKFRMVAFHNAGSAESVWSGRGMRQPTDNPFVLHCNENGGELLACELPGRETRRKEPRHETFGPYCEALYPILAPYLQEDVPYVLIGHSMGTWMLYSFLNMLSAKGIPLPKQLVISGFPNPSIPFKERPWNVNKPMADPAFMDEARGWDVNEVVFQPGNWDSFKGMMRDDFTLFDSYDYAPPPAHHANGFPVPIQAYYAEKDKRIKKHHLEGWKKYTTEAYSVDITPGNHLFFYDNPARAKFMEAVIAKLPAAFK